MEDERNEMNYELFAQTLSLIFSNRYGMKIKIKNEACGNRTSKLSSMDNKNTH